MSFWSESATEGSKDPKRNFRFKIEFTGLASNQVWFAKKVGKPNFSITESTHEYFNHKFYYPGRVEWQPVTLTIVDPVDTAVDAAAQMSALVVAAGYQIPTTSAEALVSMSKGKAVAAIGTIKIIQLDSNGVALETWVLTNPFIKSLKFGDLDYSNDDITEMEMEIRYDYATWESGGSGTKADLISNNPAGASPKSFFGPVTPVTE